jgi:hypothetical protein
MMSEDAVRERLTAGPASVGVGDVVAYLAGQEAHPLIPKVALVEETPDEAGRLCVKVGGVAEWITLEEVLTLVRERDEWILNAEANRFEDGIWFATWEENLWEIARLRVANPGAPVTFLCAGSNGSSKSEFAAAVMVRAMMQTDQIPRRKAEQPVFWFLAETEPKSVAVEQPKVYAWLPSRYKPAKGSILKTGRGKLGYTDASGFTDNSFSLYHGAIGRFRFWSAKPDTVLEGPRPIAAWSDEELPFYWLEQIEKRLLTEAEHSRVLVPTWERLLKEREKDPGMPFPKDRVGALMMGVHLLTYTAKNGYTDTVRAFMDGGRVVQEIEADPELLPRRNEKGEIVGGEWMPKLVHCKLKHRRARFVHAWENPLGGNWSVMREQAMAKGRTEVLWWCYGVAERSSDSPFPNFDVRIHVRPAIWLPRRGSWWHICDPNAAGGRNWFHLWGLVVGEYWHGLAPGDLWVHREWPGQKEPIPGHGSPGPWALQGGKDGQGLRGPAQQPWAVGIHWRGEEIKRVEREIATEWGWPAEKVDDWEVMKGFIPDEQRVIDARPASTNLEGQMSSQTLGDLLEDEDLHFLGAGRDSGASVGETNVRHGVQMVNSALAYDRDLAKLNPKTGWLEIDPKDGRGPKVRINEACENLIEAVQNYPGDAKKECAWKDPIDCLRYWVISKPEWWDEADRTGEPGRGF